MNNECVLDGQVCPPSCYNLGEVCAVPADCCSGTCNGGLCSNVASSSAASSAQSSASSEAPLACFALGEVCAVPADCCSGTCNGGLCEVAPASSSAASSAAPPACFALGEVCADPADCCSNTCNGGLCEDMPQSSSAVAQSSDDPFAPPSPPDPFVCTSEAWPYVEYTIPYVVRPGGVNTNDSTVKCVDECSETNPQRHDQCTPGLYAPFCVRAPNNANVIAGETETDYLLSHLFGNNSLWNPDSDCSGKCSPAPGQTSVLCDGNQSPFLYNALVWEPNCSNGVCQQPSFSAQDAGNPAVLCASDIRMTQCAKENDNTAYAFIPDGYECNTDLQCYHGSNRPGWRPYGSVCLSNGYATVCTPDMGAASSASSDACIALDQVCTFQLGANPCCSGMTCIGTCEATETVGATDDFFSFDISNRNHINYLDSIWTGGANKISLSGTAAYLASPKDDAEMIVVNITNPAAMFKKGEFDLADSRDGLAIHRTGSAALLGRSNVTAGAPDNVDDVALTHVPGNIVPPVGATVYFHTASGGVMDVDTDEQGIYGFLALKWWKRPLEIVCLKDKLQPVQPVTFYPTADFGQSMAGRGLFYDIPSQRLYLSTEKGLYIFTPASGVPTCL